MESAIPAICACGQGQRLFVSAGDVAGFGVVQVAAQDEVAVLLQKILHRPPLDVRKIRQRMVHERDAQLRPGDALQAVAQKRLTDEKLAGVRVILSKQAAV